MKTYRPEAQAFYQSPAWKACRESYKKSVGGLCERCRERGLIEPGVIVHHVRHIDIDTIDDPGVLLAWDNLQLVCRKCHAELHDTRQALHRFELDELGRVVAMRDPPM